LTNAKLLWQRPPLVISWARTRSHQLPADSQLHTSNLCQ